jgi:rubredoxin
MTTPETKDIFTWDYKVTRDGITVSVTVEDAHDKEICSGFLVPSVKEWEKRGWTVTEKQGDREDGIMWRCAMCKWLYKEDKEGIRFESLPDDWRCPRCKVPKNEFERIG